MGEGMPLDTPAVVVGVDAPVPAGTEGAVPTGEVGAVPAGVLIGLGGD
jgi:hypothetical protein